MATYTDFFSFEGRNFQYQLLPIHLNKVLYALDQGTLKPQGTVQLLLKKIQRCFLFK